MRSFPHGFYPVDLRPVLKSPVPLRDSHKTPPYGAGEYFQPNVKRWDVLCCPFRAHISGDMVTLGRCPRLNCTALSGRKTGSHCGFAPMART